jgi:hypothetical protein
MRRGWPRALLVTLVMLAVVPAGVTPVLHAQAVRGRVTEAETRQPIAGVQLRLINSSNVAVAQAVSSDDGLFVLPARSAGWHRIEATRVGYADLATERLNVRRQEIVAVDLRLSRRAIPLNALTVTARRPDPRHDLTYEGLYSRYALLPPIGPRRAVLFTDAEMEASSTVTEVIQWFSARPPECTVVFWNGHPMHRDIAREMLTSTSVRTLEGIEFYRTLDDVPAAFRGFAYDAVRVQDPRSRRPNCVTVALWALRPPAFRGDPANPFHPVPRRRD